MRFASLLRAVENLNGRSRLFLAIAVAVLVFLLLPSSSHLISRFLTFWIAGVAFTISMTSQTSDVSITSRYLQRLVLVQELVPFFFYSVIIASSVDLIAGLV
jgi:uncharacterized membrane protein